ncbi:MAG: arylsulfatase [Opitutaceae bacterium]|nr:arylsulfatase [Cytophagales bacterium]
MKISTLTPSLKSLLFLLILIWVQLDSLTVSAQYDPVQPWKGKQGKNAKESEPYKAEPIVKTPAKAPNVVYILLDDVGYGAISPFGGQINTPNLEALANNGLRYTNFHTTAICSPTRAALLTGRNQHSAHMGLFPETAIDYPGYDARIPFEKAFISEALRENGYNTFAVGKWHLTPVNEVTQAGPFNRWPTGRGFEKYFGFLYGETDQYTPFLIEGTDHYTGDTKGKHFTTLITDKAIGYIGNQKSVNSEKPFFLYYATGAGHAPHQVDKSWTNKYKGKFDKGWDKYREEVLINQKKLGVVPEYVTVPAYTNGIKPWDSLSVDQKKVYARFQEAYAGFLEHTDYEIGRLISYLKSINQFDNTLFVVVVGDNGSSKEGTQTGVHSGYINAHSEKDRISLLLKDIDNIGTDKSIANFPLGWAQATNTPFRYLKQEAHSEGGTHNPLIIHWPNGIKDKGGIRNQFSHVNSIYPTTIELTGSKIPQTINGYPQEPLEGVSLGYTIDNPKASSRHTQQYFEISGSRSIYKDGWKAGAIHKLGLPFETEIWELYNLNEDFNEQKNLASQYPDKLKELQDAFDSDARKYNVYPLKDWTTVSFGQENAGAWAGKSKVILYPGLSHTFALSGPVLRNRSFSITADAEISNPQQQGVLYAIGGRFGGFSFFVKDAKLQVANNFGGKLSHLESARPLPTGKVTLKVEINYTGKPAQLFDYTGQFEDSGTEVLYINGEKVAEKKILKGESGNVGGYDEGFDVGRDQVSPVSDRYKTPFVFTGKLNTVTIDLK